MPHWTSNPRHRALIWCACVVLALATLAALCVSGIRLETNILKLLPASEQDPVLNAAVENFADQSSRKVILLVGHTDRETAREAARHLAEQLNRSAQFSRVSGRTQSNPKRTFYELYFPARAGLLPSDLLDELESRQGLAPLLDQMMETLYTPAMPGLGALLEADPLLLFPLALKNLPPAPGKTTVQDGYIEVVTDETTWIVVQALLQGSAFSRSVQQPAVQDIEEAVALTTTKFRGTHISYSGVIKFAHASARKAEREAGFIGTLSMLAVFLLLLATFRSVRQLLLGILPILVGVLFAFTGSVLLFGELHLLTLGFGASMIGVCIDYTFHYFAESLAESQPHSPGERLRRVLPGITLGMITSVLAYLSLCIAPFPGLRQMAVFSCIGLIGAFGTVVCLLPVLPQGRPRKSQPAALALGIAWLALWSRFLGGRRAYVMMALLLAAGITGALRLQPNDDVRALQPQDADLLQNESAIQALTGPIDFGRFFVVQGNSEEQLLQHEEALMPALRTLVREHQLEWMQGLSLFVPSLQRQQSSRDLLSRLYRNDTQAVMQVLSSLGMAPSTMDSARRVLTDTQAALLTPTALLEQDFAEAFRTQWLGQMGNKQASIVLLGGIHDEAPLQALGRQFPQVRYVNKVAEISGLFGRYRRLGAWLVSGAYLLIGLFLFRRYGWRRFARVFLPPCTAAVGTLGLLGFMGQPLTLFHVLALLLVLGIGIDYTIFFAESRSRPANIMLAVILSACTTMLSFGLLSLSSTRALADFGLTVLLGILLGLLLAPMAVFDANPKEGDPCAAHQK